MTFTVDGVKRRHALHQHQSGGLSIGWALLKGLYAEERVGTRLPRGSLGTERGGFSALRVLTGGQRVVYEVGKRITGHCRRSPG